MATLVSSQPLQAHQQHFEEFEFLELVNHIKFQRLKPILAHILGLNVNSIVIGGDGLVPRKISVPFLLHEVERANDLGVQLQIIEFRDHKNECPHEDVNDTTEV